jgi:DNA-binding transcriptional ArsR family regulator
MLRKSALVFAALGDVTRQAVTRHMDVLASSGLVRDVKQGRERLWH